MPSWMRPLALITCLVFLHACGSASSNHRLQIYGGHEVSATDPSPLYRSTVFIGTSGDQASVFCSGSLIGPLQVLTAAHCVVQNQKTKKPSEIYVGFGTSQADAVRIDVATIRVHPDWRSKLKNSAADMAVLTLTEEHPETHQPIALYTGSDAALKGQQVEIAGYGSVLPLFEFDENGKVVGPLDPNHPLRQAAGALKGVLKATKVEVQDTANGIIKIKGEFLNAPCHGDSGGPLYYFLPKSQQVVLAGVTSKSASSFLGDCLAQINGVDFASVGFNLKFINILNP